MPTHMINLFNIIETIEAELGGELTAIQQYKIKQQARKLIAEGTTNEDDLAGEVAFWFAANGIC
jgi:bacterioferritin (cytochrome b1)